MTRTERAAFPRAVVKDRSLSRSGLDKSIRKNGAGQHNWGSISDEAELEFAALEDEEHDIAADAEGTYALSPQHANLKKPAAAHKVLAVPSSADVESAKKFRKTALKSDELDLAAIARTSAAVSTSPIDRVIPVTNDADTAVL